MNKNILIYYFFLKAWKKNLLGTDMKDNLLFKYREQMSALNCFWKLAGKSLINKGRVFHHSGIYMEAISISKGKPQVLNEAGHVLFFDYQRNQIKVYSKNKIASVQHFIKQQVNL